MTFSATDAAFEGFRVVRRKPLMLIFWALAYLAFFALFFGLAGASLVGIMSQMEAMEGGGGEPAFADVEALGQTYVGLMVWALPLGLLFGAVLSAAVARAVVRPAESAFGYLRLGLDELRVLAVTFVLTIVFFVASVVVFGLVGAVAGATSASGQNALWLLVILLGLAGVAFLIWLMVRLSLAVPITVAERRISLFDSFGLTKGSFWPLLGMAIIAGIMTILVSILSSIVVWPVSMVTGGIQQLASLPADADISEMWRLAGPAIIAWVVVNAVFSALQLAVIYAPFSAAYLGLKGLPAPE